MNKHDLQEVVAVHADAYAEANRATHDELLAATAGQLAAAGASNKAYEEAMEVVTKEKELEAAACDMVVDFVGKLPGYVREPDAIRAPNAPIPTKGPFAYKAVKANCVWLGEDTGGYGDHKEYSPFYIVGQTEPFNLHSKRRVVQLLLASAGNSQVATSDDNHRGRHARKVQLTVVHAWADDATKLFDYAQSTVGTDAADNIVGALAANPYRTVEINANNAIMKAQTVYNHGEGVGDTGFSLVNLAHRFSTPLSILLKSGLDLSVGQPMKGLSDVDMSRFNVPAYLGRLAEQFNARQELDAAIDKNLV
jgi:hypothetical protein